MPKFDSNKQEIIAKSALMLLFTFVALFVTNYLVISVANFFFPSYVVLGTMALTSIWALILSSTKLALWGVALVPLVYYYEWKNKRNFTDKEWMTLYFIANAGFVWLLTRFAEIYGMGVSSWGVVIMLALVLDFVQGLAMMLVSKIKIR